ncbi:MAG: hypothetical protein RMK20_04890 [Verrucomicrobiales bacterium]|nr:hypothetical protein [Verrucomicrobiales bacterium]
MTRLWTGLFLLAASWLAGTGYYRAPQWALWAVLVVAGCAFVIAAAWAANSRHANPSVAKLPSPEVPTGLPGLLCVLLLVAPIWIAPWPHRTAPLLLAVGILIGWRQAAHSALPAATTRDDGWTRWRTALSGGLVLSGLLLALQDLALLLYRTWTSYSHELPAPVAWLLAQLFRLFGMEAAAEQTNIHLFTMRQVHPLGATWELLLPPHTWCFLVGGLALWLALRFPHLRRISAVAPASESKPKIKNRPAKPAPHAARSRWLALLGAWLRELLPWAAPVLLWLPLRAALFAGWMLHSALRTEYEEPLDLMWPFWNTWVLIAADVPLLWLQTRWINGFVRGQTAASVARDEAAVGSAGASAPAANGSWPAAAAAALPAVAAVVCFTLGVIWDPAGQRKAGRVAVDEFHSKWEPTERAFDTEWYGHLSGYNYWCIYDFSTRFYQMSRIKEPLTDAVLANLDVLILKVPTEPYRPEEIEAVLRFVERGGGLLLIGEHTDVFGTGYHLNQIARRFGFEYRYDCLFGIDSFFDQFYVPSFAPHPVVRAIRGMDFATSCSIRPFQPWRGRSVITSTGLKNAMADYHASNFYPPAQDRADMRYGAFVQLWAARHGKGRVLAFTDSTIFSNFCTFEPGKLELLRGMIEWVNRRDAIGNPRGWLFALGAVAGVWTLLRLRKQPRLFLPLVAVGGAAWALTIAAVVAAQARSFQLPAPERPLRWVTIDRTLCEGPLSKNGFIEGKANGFGIFERWILRLGYFIRRESGPAALRDDLVVFLQPTRPVPPSFAEAARRYVESGGHMLVLDSAENTNSTAAALLAPFKLELRAHPQPDGKLEVGAGWPAIEVQAAREVVGGEPFAKLHGRPVAARASVGRGSVTVLGIGARFTDVRMGVTGDVEPDATLRQVYEFQFRLLRWLVEGNPDPRPRQTE